MIPWTYSIINSEGYYSSKDIRYNDPGWRANNFRGIQSFTFWLPNNKYVFLSGMEEYNFFIEALQDFGPTIQLCSVFILGKHDDKVYGYRVGEQKIQRIESLFGEEYNGTASNGWKHGIKKEIYVIDIYDN